MLSGRKKYAGLSNLTKLAKALNYPLSELVSRAEGELEENFYEGGAEAEFLMRFEKKGVLFSSDIPPNPVCSIGRLVLDPKARLSLQTRKDSYYYLRPITAGIEVFLFEKIHRVRINHKVFFNGRLSHEIRNPSSTHRATVLFVTQPSMGTLHLTS